MEQTLPANGFWLLTMYDAGYFLVPNKLNRFAPSLHFKFKHNQDGSLTHFIQSEGPTGQGQGVQLADGCPGADKLGDADLLPEGISVRRHLEAAGSDHSPSSSV